MKPQSENSDMRIACWLKTKSSSGFSLIEMAIVLLIMGLILGGLLVALGQSNEGTRRTDTSTQLKQIEEALYGYAQTYGRLPCPATNASAGAEAITGGNCTSVYGFVPSATLGLQGAVNQNRLLTDPWGNPYRYSVAQLEVSGNRAFTSSLGLKAVFANPGSITGNTMLRVCEQAACTNILANDNVPAVVLSMGANWATSTDADEAANAANSNIFVSTTYRDDSYDDIVVWLSPNILFSRMISAGALP